MQAKPAAHGQEISAREAWKLFGIMAEFFSATERLVGIQPAVSVFGSARVKPGTPYYQLAEETARLLSDAGFTVISGGGPGLMEATNKGAFEGKGLAVGLNIDLPKEQHSSRYQHISLRFKHFFARKVTFARYASAFVVLPGATARSMSCSRRSRSCRPARRATCRSSWCTSRTGEGCCNGAASASRRRA
jgi:hypothetical protein